MEFVVRVTNIRYLCWGRNMALLEQSELHTSRNTTKEVHLWYMNQVNPMVVRPDILCGDDLPSDLDDTDELVYPKAIPDIVNGRNSAVHGTSNEYMVILHQHRGPPDDCMTE
jgi:hypothetical protein